MKPKEIYEVIDSAYPKRLSDEYISFYGGHDNSGLLIDLGDEVTGVLFSLDLSLSAIEEAKSKNCNLIVTHHPAIFYPVSRLSIEEPVSARLIRCIRSGISVISMHLNLDCAARGIDYYLSEAIKGRGEENPNEKVEDGGYGRIYEISETTAKELCDSLKKVLRSDRVVLYGNNCKVGKVASFCGAGVDGGAIAAAKANGAQMIVSSDVKHNFICDILESGMGLITVTHYAGENYGFEKIYRQLEGKLGIRAIFHEDADLL